MSDTVGGTRKLNILAEYRRKLNKYASECLRIRDKQGAIELFPGFNSAQKYLHRKLEEQLREKGFVRAIVLKGRQQGVSTYTAIRYYRKASLFRGVNVYILSHEQTASDSIFEIVDRFQVHNPIRPSTGTANVKELKFDKLDSSYTVATAGQKAVGRSKTTTLFHGSEVAFWQSAKDHFAASVQTVPLVDGTEIILESTANGASGEFYERWQDAVNGVGDYIPIFIPWFWQEEYRRAVAHDFELSSEPGDTGVSEKEYQKLFDLSYEQMAWRRAKVAELRSVHLFDQEYPASPEMAFQSADAHKCLILPIQVLRARKRKDVHGAGPLIIGADPSGPGKDRFAVAARQGQKVLWVEYRQMPETAEAVLWLKAIIDDNLPDRMFVDLGNLGHSIVSLLKGLVDDTGKPAKAPNGKFYHQIVRGVNFGGTSQSKLARPKVPGPKNRRAEMWDRSREWLELEEGSSLPDGRVGDMLQADATGPHKKPQLNNDFYLESKEQMQIRGVRSPDLWDAVALTFAEIERIIGSETRGERGNGKRLAESRTVASSPTGSDLPPMMGGDNSWMGL